MLMTADGRRATSQQPSWRRGSSWTWTLCQCRRRHLDCQLGTTAAVPGCRLSMPRRRGSPIGRPGCHTALQPPREERARALQRATRARPVPGTTTPCIRRPCACSTASSEFDAEGIREDNSLDWRRCLCASSKVHYICKGLSVLV